MLRLHIHLLLMFEPGEVQPRYFGLHVTVTLFSRQQGYQKCMEKKIHESDEHASFFESSVLQYLRTCLLYKS